MVTTKSVRWDEVPGFDNLSQDTQNDLNSDNEILDVFILRDEFNPTNIEAYISPRNNSIYLIYYNQDSIELIRTLDDNEDNRKYTIMRLSNNAIKD